MKSTADIAQISVLTGVTEGDVAAILRILQAGEPTSIDEAQAICGSKFATDEEKARARKKWAQLSEAEIDAADSFPKAEMALRRCDPGDKGMMIKAINNAIARHRRPHDLDGLLCGTRDIPDAIKKKLDPLTRAAMIKHATTPAAAINMWRDFAGTEDEEALLLKTQSLLDEITSDDASRANLWSLYSSMPQLHPKRYDAYAKWADCPQTEAGLRAVHARSVEELKTAKTEPKGYASEKEKAQKAAVEVHLTLVIANLARRIDEKHKATVEGIDGYDALINASDETQDPQLPSSRQAITAKLEVLWEEKLSGSLDFEGAFALFETMAKVYRTNMGPEKLSRAWKIMMEKAGSLPNAKRMIDLVSFSETLGFQAVQLWLTFKPELDELMAVHKSSRSSRESILEAAIIAKSTTVQKAVSTIVGLSWSKEGLPSAFRNLAAMIQSLEDGLEALRPLQNGCHTRNGERAIVLEAALTHATKPIWLTTVVGLLGSYKDDPEERMLVAKALELASKQEE